MIGKLGVVRCISDGRFRVFDRKGMYAGTFVSRAEAERRLDQAEYFQESDKNVAVKIRSISKDLRSIGEDDMSARLLSVIATEKADLSYSYMMRELRQGDPEHLKSFMTVFKKSFDEAVVNDIDEPANIALMAALKAIGYDDGEE